MVMRREILIFASAMENKMATHDKDRGDEWKHMSIQQLAKRLGQEFAELKSQASEKDIRRELVDVANFCMMLWHALEGKK